MPRCMVTAPTAASKDYALDRWLECYENMALVDSLFIVDTTYGTSDYEMELVGRVGRNNVARVAPPDNGVFNLVHIVSCAWTRILQEARRRGVRWIFSIEIDVYVPSLTYVHMSHFAGLDYINACLVTHGYPYPLHERPLHSCGCMLIDPTIFPDGQEFYLGGNPQFEDEVWAAAYRSGRGVMMLDNIFRIEHDNKEIFDGIHT